MKKQTAVEWLVESMFKYGLVPKTTHPDNVLFHKAKEMEKKQMVDFALSTQEMFKHQIEEKYNETYEGDK